MLVDFLFIEILSAPVAEDEHRLKNIRDDYTHDLLTKEAAVLKELPNTSSRSTKLVVGTTRLIPPGVTLAHNRARDSITEVLNTAKTITEKRVTRINARQTRVFAVAKSGTPIPLLDPNEKRPANALSCVDEEEEKRSELDWGELSVDDLFGELVAGIQKQRSLLKRVQQQHFDNLWGYVCHSCDVILAQPLIQT